MTNWLKRNHFGLICIIGVILLLALCTGCASAQSTESVPALAASAIPTQIPLTDMPTSTLEPTLTPTSTETPDPTNTPPPTPTNTPTPEPWEQPGYFDLTFEHTDGTPRFPIDLSLFNNMMSPETMYQVSREVFEFDTLLSVSPSNQVQMQTWGEEGLRRINEMGGWPYAFQLNSAIEESVVGIISDPRTFGVRSPDPVHPLAMARNAEDDGYVLMYTIEHDDGAQALFFLSLDSSMSMLWGFMGRTSYILSDNDNTEAVAQLHEILMGIYYGENQFASDGGVIPFPVINLQASF